MELKIGKYTLKSDKFCAWLEKECKTEQGKTTQRRVTGYFRDFNLLLDDFIDTKVKESDASDMKQALAEIDSALKDAKRIAKETVKADFHIVRERSK